MLTRSLLALLVFTSVAACTDPELPVSEARSAVDEGGGTFSDAPEDCPLGAGGVQLCHWGNNWSLGWGGGWANGWGAGTGPEWGDAWNGAWRSDWDFGWARIWANKYTNSWSAAFSAGWNDFWTNGWHGDAGWSRPGPKFNWVTGGQSCAHPVTQTGEKLDPSCGSVVAQVCSASTYIHCCAGEWDLQCAQRAVQLGDDRRHLLGAELDHDVSQTGAAFLLGESACVAKVCGSNGFEGCCKTRTTSGPKPLWGPSCVEKAADVCVQRYVTRTRTDDDDDHHVMVDACYEAREQGVPACPVAGVGTNGKECCWRTMALHGTYWASDSNTDTSPINDGLGRDVNWIEHTTSDTFRNGQTDFGLSGVNATLVFDPCNRRALDGTNECMPFNKLSKLWMGAGAASGRYQAGLLHPDCSGPAGNGGPRPCTSPGLDTMTPWAVNGTTMYFSHRNLLLMASSALGTTNGSYLIDIRFHGAHASAPAPFVYDDYFDFAVPEAEWNAFTYSGNVTRNGVVIGTDDLRSGYMACYDSNGPLRAAGALTAFVPPCDPIEPVHGIIESRYWRSITLGHLPPSGGPGTP